MAETAATWVRVSSGGQDEANQVPDIARHVSARGYDVRREYVLHDKSASKGEQQSCQDQVVADMKAGLFTVLVCWHSDRVDRRGIAASLGFIDAVRAAGGRIESVLEPWYATEGFAGEVMTSLAAAVAKQETQHKRERIKIAKDRIAQAGALDGRTPWGYASGGDKYGRALVPTDLGRAYVPGIFARVIAGDSLAAVARWLESEGVPPAGIAKARNPKGKTGQWWPRTLGEMIRNPAYMGYRTDGAGKTVHRCEPLVDAATFRAAGLALDGRPKRGPQNAENRAMLAGAVFCGSRECTAGGDQSPMYRIMSRYAGGRVAFYRCAGRGADRKGCGNMVRADVADAAMNAIAAEWFGRPVLRTEIRRGHTWEAEIEALRFELRQLPARELDYAEEDRERARLRALIDDYRSRDAVPDEPVTVETDETYADVWAALPVNERGAWLKEKGLTVCATKTAMWFRENSPAVLSMLTRNVTVPAVSGPAGEMPEHTVTDTVTDRRQLIYIYPPRAA